ncbi:Nonribosomal peptide synthetase easA, partial [Lachnellula suecica]
MAIFIGEDISSGLEVETNSVGKTLLNMDRPTSLLPTVRREMKYLTIRRIQLGQNIEKSAVASSYLTTAWALVVSTLSQVDDVTFDLMNGPSITPLRIFVDGKFSVSHLVSNVTSNVPTSEEPKSRHESNERLGSVICLNLSEVGTGKYCTETPYLLMLECSQLDSDGFSVNLRYMGSEFSSVQAQRILDRFIYVIEQFGVLGPERLISDVKMCTPGDEEQLKKWNGAPVPPIQRCIHHVVEDQVKMNPLAPAVAGWDASFTYGELQELSVKLAKQLQLLGVVPETIVPICFEKSAWVVVSMNAILLAGGVVMCLEPSNPEARLKNMLERADSKFDWILCSQKQLELCQNISKNALIVDSESLANLPESSSPLAQLVGPHNRSIIQHTSGSTGVPKGIEVTHKSYCTAVNAHGPRLDIGPGARIYQFASCSFDAFLSDIVTALMRGACICMPKDADRTDRLAESITEFQSTWIFLTPSILRLIQPSDVPSLKTIVTGGERVDESVFETWAEAVDLIEVWGPSETGVYATSTRIEDHKQNPANIGHPIGCRTWIVDPNDLNRLAPIGSTGEIIIEGGIVAKGYLNLPDLTSLAFVGSPQWLNGGLGKVYRTGDLAKYDSDGSMIFVGRKDTQVKYHGQRIELGDIEHNVALHADVDKCAVFFPSAGPYTGTIVAVLQLRETARRSVFGTSEMLDRFNSIKHDVRTRLASYMIPTTWLFSPSMPVNQSTKVDRKLLLREIESLNNRLPEEPTLVQQKASNRSDDSPLELSQVVRRAIRDILNREVLPEQSFIGQGGDSISAMRVVNACRGMGVMITVKDILMAESLAELLQNAKDERSEYPGADTNTSKEKEMNENAFESLLELVHLKLPELFDSALDQVEEVLPCSPVQEGILLSQSKESEKYSTVHAFEISTNSSDGPLSMLHLEAAWKLVVQRHQALRTVFLELMSEFGPFVQIVLGKAQPEFVVHSDPSDLAARMELPMIGQNLPHRFRVASKENRLICRLEMSHAIIDGESIRVILEDLALAYEGKLPAGTGPLYGNYIFHLFQLPKDKALDYWVQYLHEVSPCILKLPQEMDIAEEHYSLESLEFTLHPYSEWQACIEQSNISPASLIQATWALLLSVYTGQQNVCFAYITAGRDAPIDGIDAAVGPFIHTLICRLAIEEDMTALNLLQTIKKDYMHGSVHQHASVASVMHKLNISSRSTFNTLVTIVHASNLDGPKDTRLKFDKFKIHSPTEFDLTLDATLSRNGVDVRLDYRPSVFTKESVERIGHNFRAIFDSLLGQLHEPLRNLDLISNVDVSQVNLWNQIMPGPLNTCIHEVISRQATMRQHKQAICSWDRDFTYDELERVTDDFAVSLQEGGVRAETVVPICLEKSAWAIIAMISVLKAGGAFLLLDPAHPTDRLLSISERVEAHLIVVSSTTAEKWGDTTFSTVECSAEGHGRIKKLSKSQRPRNISCPENMAYVVFTSGSTGQPKGIMTEHGAYCSSAMARKEIIQRDQNSRHLQWASYNFDMCIEDMLTTLMVGGTICIPSEAERLNDIPAALRRMNVNSAMFTPSVATMLSPEDVPSLKTLALGGEALTPALLQKWAPVVSLSNLYGPAEACVHTVVFPKINVNQKYASNIGRGAAAITWVTSPHNHHQLVPIGAVGELLLEGPGLARGYLKQQDKTDASFIRNPAWLPHANPARRFYKTGDLVQYLANGNLVYLGRKDTQVKLYGQRIELGEIDAAFLSRVTWPAAVCSVLASALARPGKPFIATFFTIMTDEVSHDSTANIVPLSPSLRKSLLAIEEQMSKTLPSFMMPELRIPLIKIPTNLSGKIDRRKLIAMAEQLSTQEILEYSLGSSVKRMPTTKAEKRLQTLWSKILGLEIGNIGADDSFTRLGGDSVLIMKLASLARSDGLSLTVAMIFRNPILQDMAQALSKDDESSPIQEYELVPQAFDVLDDHIPRDMMFEDLGRHYSIEKDQIEDVYPCTPLQEGLMALSMRQKTAYTARLVHQLKDDISISRLQAAWSKVVEGQPVLRTRIVHSSRLGALQVVMKTAEHRFLDASGVAQYTEADKMTSMQYGQDLSRCAIVTEGDRTYFIWTIHHSIYDGWMLDIILRQVVLAYEGQKLDPSPPFSRFVGFLQQQQREGKSQLFWRDQFRGFQPVEFPTRPSAFYSGRVDKSCNFRLPISKTVASGDYTMASIVRAAWGIVVANYSESQDVVFGAVLTGRTAPVKGITEMVGPTLTTVPIRIDLSKHNSVSGFLDAVQAQSVEMMPYEHTGLQNIRVLDQDCQNACAFQNLLVVHPPEITNTSIGFFGPQEMIDVATLGFHTYPLVLGCAIGSGDINLHFSFDANIVTERQVEQLSFHLQTVVNQLCNADPGTLLEQIDLFGDSDYKQICKWNSEEPVEQNLLVHNEILKQVLAQPDAEAIYAWDGCLTYQELDSLSTYLAEYLISRGLAGPDVLIPILLEKSSWVPVCMLSVLKAGSGFVPLDASHPPARLQEIIGQANPSVMLVSPETVHLGYIAPATLQISHQFFAASDQSQDKFFCLPHVLNLENSTSSLAESQSTASDNSEHPSSSANAGGTTPRSSPPLSPRPGKQSAPAEAHNIAYAIFTSGSTGKPKGVLIEHGQFCSGVIGPRKEALVRSTESRVLQFASLSFDTSLEDILTTLLFGGTVCIPSEKDRVNNITAFINNSRANTAHITPSFANTLSPDAVPTLKALRLGGERMTPGHVTTWAAALDLRNVYGPTETTITATCSTRVTSDSDCSNIGKGVAALIWIVNPENHDQLTPLGLVGEMLVEGPLLARGYLNDQEKTDKAFIINPKWSRSGDQGKRRRFYKTGDLCRYDAEGNILYIGRKDTQVKIYGQRTELGEVEDHLKKALGESRDVAVEAIDLPGAGSHKALVAMICLGDDFIGDEFDLANVNDETIANLRQVIQGVDATMSKTLPQYMIPSRFIPIKTLPTTISKKTDRKKLQAMLSVLSTEQLQVFAVSSGLKEEPSTEMEFEMQSLWASVLNLPPDQVGANDNFLRLGGDSIMAIKLASILREKYMAISVSEIFSSLDLRQMAKQAEASHGAPLPDNDTIHPFSLIANESTKSGILQHLSHSGIGVDQVQDAYPCTPLQEGLLSLSAKTGEAYISQSIFKLPPGTDLDRFKAAWDRVIQSNDILRTWMVDVEANATVQVVLKSHQPSWQHFKALPQCLAQSLKIFDIEKELANYALCDTKDDNSAVFVHTIHHAIYDGWCYPEILRQVDDAYIGTAIGETKHTPFSYFVRHLQNVSGSSSANFWSAKFDGSDGICDLPVLTRDSDKKLASMADIKMSSTFSVPPGVKATPSILIRAAWALSVSYYAGSSDVIFGASITGRNADVPGIDSIIGPTIATIPILVHVDRDLTIDEFLESLIVDMVRTMPFEHFGLQNIQSLNTDIKRHCNFSSLLVVQQKTEEPRASSLFSEPTEHPDLHDIDHPYPIAIECEPQDNALEIRARFDTNAISKPHMLQVLRTFENIIAELCLKASRRLSDIDPISQLDLNTIRSWNKSVPEMVLDTVQNALEKQLKREPEAQAVYTTDLCLTYGDLDLLTDSLAHVLNDLGIGPGCFVPLLFEKSAWHTVSMLAVIRTGATFVTLDPSNLPAARLNHIVSQCKFKVLLTSDKIGPGLPSMSTVRKIQVSAAILTKPGATNSAKPLTQSSPNDVLYTVFTSGSTGQPKGVVVSNKAFMSVLQPKLARFEITASTRALQFVSHAMDSNIYDILLSVLSGGCVCVPDEEARLGGLEEFIAQSGANSAEMTPSAAATMDAERASKHLKRLGFIGERVRDAHVQQWVGHVKTYTRFGPSEGLDNCISTARLSADYEDAANFGTALGCLTWVVDEHDHNKLLPIGAVGELCIQGPGLADGYLYDDERTSAIFVEAPSWAQRPDSHGNFHRMYKTRDLVRYEANGTLTFVRRKDDQIKLRGLRIELGEVEYHISRIESLRDVIIVVDVRPLDESSAEVLGVFVPESSTLKDYQNVLRLITDALSQVVPSFMVPTVLLPIPAIPLTGNGKIDRRKLRVLAGRTPLGDYVKATVASTEFKKPTSHMELQMQKLWATILKLEATSIGNSANFFNLGGDSISVMRLVNAARAQNITIRALDVFKQQTLEGVAKRATTGSTIQKNKSQPIENKQSSHRAKQQICDMMNWDVDSVEKIVPGSDFQAWCVYQSSLHSGGWRNTFNYHLDGNVDMHKLKQACYNLIKHHEILRTHFAAYKGTFLQAIFAFRHEDYTLVPYASKKGQAYSLNERPTQIYLDEVERKLVLHINHAQYDGLSMPNLLKDLSRLYSGEVLPLAQPFSEYVTAARGHAGIDEINYWKKVLKGASNASLVNHTVPSSRNVQDCTLTQMVPKMASAGSSTPATIFKAAWAMVLARVSQGEDVTFAALVQTRNFDLPGIDNIVGPCLNFVPVRAQVKQGTSLASLLDQIQVQHIESLPHSALGFRQVIEHCTDWSKWARFSSILLYQNMDGSTDEFELGGTTSTLNAIVPEADSCDVWITAVPQGSNVEIRLEFCSSIVSNDFATAMLTELCNNINLLVAGDQGIVSLEFFQPLEAQPALPIQAPIPSSTTIAQTSPDVKSKASEIVRRAWDLVLGDSSQVDIPFWDIWGDSVAAYQLASIYSASVVGISVENLMDNPTMSLQ